MITKHFKIFVCGGASFRAIREALPTLEYKSGMKQGLLVHQLTPSMFGEDVNTVRARYIFTVYGQTIELDPDSLEEYQQPTESLADARFELDQKKGLVSVEQRRGDFHPVYEMLESLPNVHVAFEDLNLNLRDLMFELQGAYKKNTVKTLRIKDYLARENMLASASFTVLEEQDAEKIAEEFDDQLEAFTLKLKLPDGACSITVTRKGSVRASQDMPDEVLEFVKDLIPQFHEAEVETTEVHSPVGAKA